MAAGTGTTGDILAILRDGTPRTKSELAQLTNQARSTVAIRLDELLSKRLVGEAPESRSTGGRPSKAYVFLGESQYVLAIDLAAHAAMIALTNLRAEVLAHRRVRIGFEASPALVVAAIVEQCHALLRDADCAVPDIVGVGIGVAAAVDFGSGHVVSPTIAPAWDDWDLAGAFAQEFGCPAFIDNDANVLAVGEQRTHFPEVTEMLYLKLDSGIGGGIISNGRLCRGGDGVAGDLSHLYSPDAAGVLCRCGNIGCVVSVAGGFALAERMTALGFAATTALDVVTIARDGNPEIAHLVRSSARAIGAVIATCVSILNPEVIVIGGDLADLGEPLIAGVREAVYGRAQPYASRRLRVVRAEDATFTAVVGAAHLVLETVLHPRRFDETFGATTGSD